ncbi:PLP-dependent aminotransferase family protein [Rhodoligotrophos defluvii]|uniref:MocR-like pyridoxine biosynthesis transcription factor PdxR n=1 Tax=Rhodoligotrophos defluvii TaxID=2561934 RepID=UPI0010C98A7E|nr:PLP-dependent aminotransferase family protein [Rhodoligotrophos defluvii]
MEFTARDSRLLQLQQPLTSDAVMPFHEQIYQRVRGAIQKGVLGAGDRLPSSRALASHLGIARGTVDVAYARLQGEGLVVAQGRVGTVVTDQGLSSGAEATEERSLSAEATGINGEKAEPLPFQIGLPALDQFPYKTWARLASCRARRMSPRQMDYPNELGFEPLRRAIASYLLVSRGIQCSAENIIITNGYQGALELIARALLQPGNPVWFENPGYFRAQFLLRSMGAGLVPLEIDECGADLSEAMMHCPNASLAILTPAHQQPLCTTMTVARRSLFLDWAGSNHSWIVEDDFDGEFHYCGVRQPAMKAMDRSDRVIYVGSFSKVLFPALRLGYMVAPEILLARLAAAARSANAGRSPFEQAIVADFMNEGYFARHVKRMRDLYSKRRIALLRAISMRFDDRLSVDQNQGGMHLIARLPQVGHDSEISRLLYRSGLAVEALSDRYWSGPQKQGLILGFTNIHERRAKALVGRLYDAIADHFPQFA